MPILFIDLISKALINDEANVPAVAIVAVENSVIRCGVFPLPILVYHNKKTVSSHLKNTAENEISPPRSFYQVIKLKLLRLHICNML